MSATFLVANNGTRKISPALFEDVVELVQRWFPRQPSRHKVESRLKKFYEENVAYHEMTFSGDKSSHPQVQLLQCLVKRDGTYAEIGCGGGAVCSLIGQTARVYGFDVSEFAIMAAKGRYPNDNVVAECRKWRPASVKG